MCVLLKHYGKQRETIDYYVYEVEFPNFSSEAMVLPNCDGTFDIYLNALFPEEEMKRALVHELEHLRKDHFYNDIKPIKEIEDEAG